MASTFVNPPPEVANVLVSFPKPHVLLITLNRPAQLNAIPSQQHFHLDTLYKWYDAEPSLRCAVLTGAGRAFCAGADLREWNERNNNAVKTGDTPGTASPAPNSDRTRPAWPDSGFGGLSNRLGKKPVLAAVNGLCLGGGMEMAINADMIIASEDAKFGLPEVTIGVIALAGALPRLAQSVGRQRAAEMALIGSQYSAEEMKLWGLVNKIVPRGGSVVEEALEAAVKIAGNSPDSVIVSRAGLLSGFEPLGPSEATMHIGETLYKKMDAGENMREGVRSFVEKRKPVWKDTKL